MHPAGYAAGLLQQRARLSRIVGSEASVDLGALLSRMTLVTPSDTAFQAAVASATVAYKTFVKQYKRDNQLADVSSCVNEWLGGHKHANSVT